MPNSSSGSSVIGSLARGPKKIHNIFKDRSKEAPSDLCLDEVQYKIDHNHMVRRSVEGGGQHESNSVENNHQNYQVNNIFLQHDSIEHNSGEVVKSGFCATNSDKRSNNSRNHVNLLTTLAEK
jgi:hypothetical protein